MSVAIVSDSGCDLPAGLEQELHIDSVPLLFRFGLEEFPDKSMPMAEFFHKVEKVWPTTSAPSPGDYLRAFRRALRDHEQVLCLAITGKHSNSYASARLAGQEFPEEQVLVMDSCSVSIGQGLQAMAAAQAAQQGQSLEQVAARAQAVQSSSHLYISLDTVQYLVRGGRANQVTGFLAGILQIKPVLTLVDGKLALLERPRGRKASKARMFELAVSHFPAEYVAVGHTGCAEEAREFASVLAQQTGYPLEKIPIVETGMAIATHAGPATLGVVVVSQETLRPGFSRRP
jgi:fatty acid kinase fatty acid binding subunit